jgi:hypothetical protein
MLVVRKFETARDVVYLTLQLPDHFYIENYGDNISICTVMFTLIPTLKKKCYILPVYYIGDEIQFSITDVEKPRSTFC